MSSRWSHIVIHHSLTQDGATVSWQAIRRYHVDVEKWADIGYQFGVEMVNNRLEALVGRGLDRDGSHTTQDSMNRKGIGICLVGNFDNEAPTHSLLLFTVKTLVIPLMRVFEIPAERVHPHRQFATYKSCPGTMFQWPIFMQMTKDAAGAAP